MKNIMLKLLDFFPVICASKLDFILLIVDNVLSADIVETGIANKMFIRCWSSRNERNKLSLYKFNVLLVLQNMDLPNTHTAILG